MSLLSRLGSRINSRLLSIRRRWTDRFVSGLEVGQRIRIFDVVCPLRYDILVRADFIAALAENDKLLTIELDELLEIRAAKSYAVWFREVCIKRFSPDIYHDENLVRQRFAIRVEKTKRLWESISLNGFDLTQPISLRSGEAILALNGKKVGASIFAGDGCHRIACLLVMGKTYLEPNEYRVWMQSEFQPQDNTALLIDKLPITEADYLTFISRGYCEGRTLTTANDAVAYLKVHDPDRLTELQYNLNSHLNLINTNGTTRKIQIRH